MLRIKTPIKPTSASLLRPLLPSDHLSVEFKELFQPLGVVFEAPADVNAFQSLIVAIVRFAKIGRHLVGIVKLGGGGWEMFLAEKQNVLSTAGKVGLVLLGEVKRRLSLKSYYAV